MILKTFPIIYLYPRLIIFIYSINLILTGISMNSDQSKTLTKDQQQRRNRDLIMKQTFEAANLENTLNLDEVRCKFPFHLMQLFHKCIYFSIFIKSLWLYH